MTTVAQTWEHYARHRRAEEGPKPTACGTLQRVSNAGTCIRQRALDALDIPECEEIDAGTLLAFSLGNTIHEQLQAAMVQQHGALTEVPIDLSHLGVSLSGHCDWIYGDTIGEVKTVSSYGAMVAWEADQPKIEHIAQAGLYGLGVGADAIHVVYVAKESDFRKGIKPGDSREWVYGMDEVQPWGTVESVASRELQRFTAVEEIIGDGRIPEALAPTEDQMDLQRIDSPAAYGIRSKGAYWGCRYCRHNTTCQQLGPDETTIERAVSIGGSQ